MVSKTHFVSILSDFIFDMSSPDVSLTGWVSSPPGLTLSHVGRGGAAAEIVRLYRSSARPGIRIPNAGWCTDSRRSPREAVPFMSGWAVSGLLFTAYVVAAGVFIIAENRRPQSTFAWIFLFLALPGFGLVIYVLFGRELRDFSSRKNLIRHDLDHSPEPLRELLEAQDETLKALEEKPGPAGRLARLVRHNGHSALTKENRVEILYDADGFYPRLIEDLKSARESIHLQFFSWSSDAFGQELKTILLAKAAEGVQVRILYDPLGSFFRMSPRYRWALRRGGVQIEPYARLYRLHTISYRNHRKIAIIDDVTGYTGGLNIGQEHIDGGAFDGWRDTAVRFVGTAAVVLQAIFAVDWANAVGEDLLKDKHFPPVPSDTSDEDIPVQITVSGPDSRWRAIRQLYFAMINSAKEHVYIQTPFFILDDTLSEALKASALSGVDVQVMLGDVGAGLHLPYWAGNTYIADVASAGVKFFLYRRDRYFHPKTISIDSEVCSIGSANMDIRSFSINYELTALIYDREKVLELERSFIADRKDCIEFSYGEYSRSRAFWRFRDSAARLFSPLL
jgi:cardiolipin synthase A/B